MSQPLATAKTVSLTLPVLSDKLYKALKHSATIILPAAGTLYFALAQIWGLPDAEQVMGSIAAVNVFVGVVVGLSTKSYNASDDKYDGTINVTQTPDGPKTFSLTLNTHPEDLETMQQVVFKVDAPA